ncbi:MAG: pseudouridine synthase [Candidatus Omnitrophica bacterium]|nr:pseudouridine synthase [Candidatus Omnitrophota bacterium]
MDSRHDGNVLKGIGPGTAPARPHLFRDTGNAGGERDRRSQESLTMRLNAYLAQNGRISRRKADALIASGSVTVNGRVIRSPGYGVADDDAVKADGAHIRAEPKKYLLLHKPKGVTSTVKDKFAALTALDLLPRESRNVYPAGRLDKNSTGMLILTNDGELCHRITHPRHEIEKEYLATLRGSLPEKACTQLVHGIRDGEDLLRVERLVFLERGRERTRCRITVREGKKRHLRRIFRRAGTPVEELHRIRIGGLLLNGLPEGQYRRLSRRQAYRALRREPE